MKTVKQLLATSALALGVSLPMYALAATDQSKSSTPMAASLADGEVRKINLETNKITIKHGPIASMDMPGMTMVFGVKDKTILNKLKAGDKIKFTVENEGGKMIVTDIQPQ